MSRLSKALPPNNYTTDEPSFYQQLETRQKVSPPAASKNKGCTAVAAYTCPCSVTMLRLKRWCDRLCETREVR